VARARAKARATVNGGTQDEVARSRAARSRANPGRDQQGTSGSKSSDPKSSRPWEVLGVSPDLVRLWRSTGCCMLCGNNSHKMASCSGVFNALLVALIASFSPLRTPKSVSALCAEVGAQGEQPGEEDGNGGQDGGEAKPRPNTSPWCDPEGQETLSRMERDNVYNQILEVEYDNQGCNVIKPK